MDGSNDQICHSKRLQNGKKIAGVNPARPFPLRTDPEICDPDTYPSARSPTKSPVKQKIQLFESIGNQTRTTDFSANISTKMTRPSVPPSEHSQRRFQSTKLSSTMNAGRKTPSVQSENSVSHVSSGRAALYNLEDNQCAQNLICASSTEQPLDVPGSKETCLGLETNYKPYTDISVHSQKTFSKSRSITLQKLLSLSCDSRGDDSSNTGKSVDDKPHFWPDKP